MSASYVPIGWNRQKKRYDLTLFVLMTIYLLIFTVADKWLNPSITPETMLIRASGTLAFLLLNVILTIGPLTRINSKFLPLLYNRRHLGVTMFFTGAFHGIFNIIQFHSLGNINPLYSVFISNTRYNSFINFPFQSLGFFALVIFFLMAITSHDFWLHNLSPRTWKTLHMMVYLAYALVVMHGMLGVIQLESSPVFFIMILGSCILLATLHLVAGLKENMYDLKKYALKKDGFFEVCDVNDIKDSYAKMCCIGGERIAIFRYDGKLSAVNNVCKHQNGPLGEGKIIDGCITCPWHGYQYLPHNGSSPPPFKEKVATYELRMAGKMVWVNPNPFPEGTAVPPLVIAEKKKEIIAATLEAVFK